MHIIDIAIRSKIAVNINQKEYICGNDDFVVRFDFDAEWDAFESKTARFVSNGGFVDVVFSGNECKMPILSNTNTILCGVFAGNLITTTPALIVARKSILCGSPVPAEPHPDVFAQIVELFNANDAIRKNAEAAALSEQNAKASEDNARTSAEAAAKSVEDAESVVNAAAAKNLSLVSVVLTLPAGRNWADICYGDGKYIAIASSTNYFAYSEDGINWEEIDVGASYVWRTITYGNGMFVAFTYNSKYYAYSYDGRNWTVTSVTWSDKWQHIAYGSGLFIVTTSNARFIYSTDGIRWKAAYLPDDESMGGGITYGNGVFVAVSSTEYHAYYSTDGINWTTADLPGYKRWADVAYGNGKFVAVGINKCAIVAYSVDGIAWEQADLPSEQSWYSIAYGNGVFVTLAHDSDIVAYSADGINWTVSNLPESADWYRMTYGDKFVIIGEATNSLAYSEDGVNWINEYETITQNGEDVAAQVANVVKENMLTVSSWNDLEDKPFGDTVTVHSDTLTWDGNTEGLASSWRWYKVSDAVPTKEEVGTESSCICEGILNEELWVQDLNGGGLHLGSGEVLIIPPSAVGIPIGGDIGDDVVFTEPGVYFLCGTTSFNIPGYAGFTKTEVQHIDPKYLPGFMFLTSPNGTRFKITVDDNGALSASAVTE